MPEPLISLTTSLATSQALRDAGFPQDAVLAWCTGIPEDPGPHVTLHTGRGLRPLMEGECAAPTFSEIWARLPGRIEPPARQSFWLCHDRLDDDCDDPGNGRQQDRLYYSDEDDNPLMLPRGAAALSAGFRGPAEVAARLYLALAQAGHLAPDTGRGEG